MTWEYPTNFSNGSAVEGIGDFLFNYPIAIIGDKFAVGIITLIWVSFFSILLIARTAKALAVSSFITLIFSIWFWARGDLNIMVPFLLLVLTIIGAVGAKGEPQL